MFHNIKVFLLRFRYLCGRSKQSERKKVHVSKQVVYYVETDDLYTQIEHFH